MCSEESKPDSDMDNDSDWILTMKANHVNSKPSVFTLDDHHSAFNNGSPNSIGSPSRDVNLNHLNIVNPSTTSQRSPSSHNQQSQGFSSSSSPSNSPTREVPDTLQMSPSSQKSIVHLKEKGKDERYVIESTIEMVKNDEFVLKKSPEKDFSMERQMKDVKIFKMYSKLPYFNVILFFRCTRMNH